MARADGRHLLAQIQKTDIYKKADFNEVVFTDNKNEKRIYIRCQFDENEVKNIAKMSEGSAVISSIAYLRKARFDSPKKFICEILNDVAFWAGTICKDHLRMYEVAVVKAEQGNHYGKACLDRMRKCCKDNGLSVITFRTAKGGRALSFFLKNGAVPVGVTGQDYEMELKI